MKYVWITQEKIKNRKTRVKKEARSGNTRISRRELSLPHHRVEHSLTENKNCASFIREPVIEASLGKQCLVHLVMRPQFVQYKDGRKTHNACWPSWSDSASSFARAWLACRAQNVSLLPSYFILQGDVLRQVRGGKFPKCAPSYPKMRIFWIGHYIELKSVTLL